MAVFAVSTSTFLNNINKYSRWLKLRSPNLSKFLKTVCDQIKKGDYTSKNYLNFFKKIHLRHCNDFKKVLIYKTFEIFFDLKEKNDISVQQIKFTNLKPKYEYAVKLYKKVKEEDQSSGATFYSKIIPCIETMEANDWKNNIKKFKNTAVKGDITTTKEYETEEEMLKAICKGKLSAEQMLKAINNKTLKLNELLKPGIINCLTDKQKSKIMEIGSVKKGTSIHDRQNNTFSSGKQPERKAIITNRETPTLRDSKKQEATPPEDLV